MTQADAAHGGIFARRSPTSITMDGRTSSFPAGMCSRWLSHQSEDRAAEYRLPQSGRNEVLRSHRRGWLYGAASLAPSRLGLRRLEWRRTPRCGGERDQCARRRSGSTRVRARSLDRVQAAGHQEQSRRHRRAHQGRDQIRRAVQPHDHSCGYASSSAGPVHFGLGANASADLVEIRWPSGIVQTLKDVAGDRVIQVKEPAK